MSDAYHHDRHRPFSSFLVGYGFIAIRPEIKSADLRRGPPHLLTDGVQGYNHATFDNELFMDMAADKAVRERLHSISIETWNIAGALVQ